MKYLNQYFFGVDKVSASDGIWFFGGSVLFISVTLILFFITL